MNLKNVYHLFAIDGTAPRYLESIRAASRLDAIQYGRDHLRLPVAAVKAEAMATYEYTPYGDGMIRTEGGEKTLCFEMAL